MSFIDHTVIFDTIHILTNETVWLPPDTLGRQYPLKTIHRESGGNRVRDSEKTYQKKDTINLTTSENHQLSTTNYQKPTTNTWLPWLILAGLILIAIIIIALRILIIRL